MDERRYVIKGDHIERILIRFMNMATMSEKAVKLESLPDISSVLIHPFAEFLVQVLQLKVSSDDIS